MMDALTKVLDLQSRARARRLAQWARVQSEAPDLAELLRECRRLFGKPSGVRVMVGGEIVVEK